jgi:hypothetical protein
MGWVVSATPRSFNIPEFQCAPCIGGWVSPTAGLDGEEYLEDKIVRIQTGSV